MDNGFDVVKRLNDEARNAGVVASVRQFDNLGVHAQYRVPYTVTSRYLTPGARALDWGCGNGHFSLLLARLGARVTGYAFEDAPACMQGSAMFTHVRGGSDPTRLPFPDHSFDCVCSVGVLEHVWETGGDEAASLAEISRVLKPGGVLLTFHLPNRHGWIEPAFRALGLNKYYHRRRYDADHIRRLWAGAALDVVELGRYNILPRNQ